MSFHSFFGETTGQTGFFNRGSNVRFQQSPYHKLVQHGQGSVVKHHDAVSSAWSTIEASIGSGAHKVEDGISSAYHTVISAAGTGVHKAEDIGHEALSIIHAGAQGGVDAFNAIGFPGFIKGIEGDVVQMLGPSPLVSGLSGSILTLGALLAAVFFLK